MSLEGFTLDDYFNQKSDYQPENMKQKSKELDKLAGSSNIYEKAGTEEEDCYEDDYESETNSQNGLPAETEFVGMSLGEYFTAKPDYQEENLKQKSLLLEQEEQKKLQLQAAKQQALKKAAQHANHESHHSSSRRHRKSSSSKAMSIDVSKASNVVYKNMKEEMNSGRKYVRGQIQSGQIQSTKHRHKKRHRKRSTKDRHLTPELDVSLLPRISI